jgi:hypothetical protein
MSGLERWRCIMKRQIVKLMGKICERRMKGCIIFVSNPRVMAIDFALATKYFNFEDGEE